MIYQIQCKPKDGCWNTYRTNYASKDAALRTLDEAKKILLPYFVEPESVQFRIIEVLHTETTVWKSEDQTK
jgi:hypothetical protein